MRWTMKSVAAALFAAATLALGLTATPASAEKRVALVIGNDKYTNLPADQQLLKAVNDSRAVGQALGKLGFEIISGENVTRAQLVDKFDEFSRKLEPGDVAFMFFAGHGVALDRGNYILPTDIPTIEGDQASRLARAALSEAEIVSDLQARNVRVAIVVLDACRNNPFKRPGQRSVGAERGLTRIDPVRGVFSIYSAGAGQSALDRLGDKDDNPNSVFTRVLVPALGKPGVPLPDLAFEVREQVAKLASTVGHDQRPAYYDETIGGRVYLAGLPSPSVQVDAGGSAPPAVAVVDPCAMAGDHWRSTESLGTVAAYEDHVTRFPLCAFAVLARAKMEQLKGQQVASLPRIGAPPPLAKSSPIGVRGGASLDKVMPASGREYFNASVIAPDRSWVATGHRDGAIRIWDVAAGRATHILRRHTENIGKLYVSPDGRTLTSLGSDDRVVVWDLATFNVRAEIVQPFDSERKIDVDRAALSADGSTLVLSASTKKVQVRDALTLAKRGEYDLGYWIQSLAVSADGSRIGLSNDWDSGQNPNSFVIADSRSGRVLAKMSRPKEPDYYYMEFFENNRIIARDTDSRYKMIDVGTGTTVWEIPKTDNFYKFKLLRDERMVMLEGGSEFSFRDVTNGREVHRFKVDRDKSKTQIPDQVFIVSDGSGPMLVDAEGAVVRRFDGIAQYASAPGFLQNGRSLLMTGKTGIVALDIASGQVSQPFGTEEAGYIRTSADGSKLMTYQNGKVRLIDAASGQVTNELTIASGTAEKTYFSDNTADLKWITLVNGKRWEIWEIPEGKLVTSGTFPEKSRNDAIGSTTLKLVMKRPNYETVDITDAVSGRTVAQIKGEKNSSIYDAVVSPNGRSLAYDAGDHIILYDLAGKRRIARSDKLDKQNPFFLPKGDRLYSGDSILDASNGRVQQRLPEGLIGYKSSTTFSPDEKFVVMTKDYGADIWDFERQRKLATFYRFADGEWALVTNEGYSASKNAGKHLAIEVGSELRPIDDAFRSAWLRESTPIEPASTRR